MKNTLLGLLALLALSHLSAQTPDARPKIGLTLSGGGAKGLAHIGVLKAIDSAGLKIDYITGTSMGSIVGGLYAIGYSADSIEKIARAADWDLLLTNKTSLRSMIMEEKPEYGRYAVELPWVKNKFLLPSGVLEGEELWLFLTELFLPAWREKDFSKFSIPFKCVGTEIATGEGLVMERGEINTAIRASMAIPTVFTAVDFDGCKLVDGGLVRNFPVSDVRAMGADFVIGSSVSDGLLPQDKLTNAAQILMQITFFQEAKTQSKEVELCDMYVHHPIQAFSAGSFGKAQAIIDTGIAEGRRLYPRLKALADSLDERYGMVEFPKNRLPQLDSVLISRVDVYGLEHTTRTFFDRALGVRTGRFYTTTQLSEGVRQVFGTRYYTHIVYDLHPLPDGTARVVFRVNENPLTITKFGVHYNGFSGIGLIGNLTSHNFLLPNSRGIVAVNVGENFRARAEYLQFFGRKNQNKALVTELRYETFALSTFQDFRRDGLNRQSYFKSDFRLQTSSRRRFTFGAGYRFESVRYKPTIQSALDIRGRNRLNSGFVFLASNTLDQVAFPNKGLKINAEVGYIFKQNPSLTFFQIGEPVGNPDTLGIRYNDYGRVLFNLENYAPLTAKWNFMTLFQSGVNFNYRANILNDFYVGGLTRQYRNQVLFAGVEESTVLTGSVAALQLGLRYEMFNNLYLTGRVNGLIHDFISPENRLEKPRFLSGYALTLGYNFALGPLELSVMYSDQSKKVGTYINLGWAF